MQIMFVEEAGTMEMTRWETLVGKGTVIGVAVGAEPTGEATEGVGLVDIPVSLRGLEIFGNFRTKVQARGATRTPLAQGRGATRILRAGRLPRIVAEWSR